MALLSTFPSVQCALETGLFEQFKADTCDLVLTALYSLTALMARTALHMQGNNLPVLFAIPVERTTVTQAQANTFTDVHNELIKTGLIR